MLHPSLIVCSCALRVSATFRASANCSKAASSRIPSRPWAAWISFWETPTVNKHMTFSPELETKMAKILESYPPGRTRSAVVPLLMFAQDEIGQVTHELVNEVAKRCQVTPLQVDEVVGYYSMLHRKPLGKYHVQVCTNISCLLVGGEELYRS